MVDEERGQGEPLLTDDEAFIAAVMDAGFVFPTSKSASVVRPWMTGVGFVFLTFYSAMAVYRSNVDWGRVVSVLFCDVCIITLFFCLRLLERAPPGSATRGKLKVAAWVLTTVLTVVFSFKVAGIMLVLVQLLVSGMAGGFYAFFIYCKRKGKTKRGFVLATIRSHHHDLRDATRSRARWIADSGATRHAVGNIGLLEGFQPYSPPLVGTQADGSYLPILGTGRIQWGNFSVPNVSLVEGVHDVLISIPQLDKDHGLISCMGKGICRIMETDGTEVGGAILERDGLYELHFLNVPGPAQVQGR